MTHQSQITHFLPDVITAEMMRRRAAGRAGPPVPDAAAGASVHFHHLCARVRHPLPAGGGHALIFALQPPLPLVPAGALDF